jgi:ribonuclease E
MARSCTTGHRIPSREQKKANIYKGRITASSPRSKPVFVDYGAERHGFLPLKEISASTSAPGARATAVNIRDVLKEGQEIVVQVEKEERGNKGAALTTFISLAGRFLVLMPNNPRAGGVSAAASRARTATRCARRWTQLKIPDGMGAIIRTAGVGRSPKNCSGTSTTSRRSGKAIAEADSSPPRALPDLPGERRRHPRAARLPADDIGEILVDDESAFQKAQEFMQRSCREEPAQAEALQGRRAAVHALPDREPDRIGLRAQGAAALRRLIVIDYTEALVSIDINSARATRAATSRRPRSTPTSKRPTRSRASCASAMLGGLIVIDFIDMEQPKNQREVEDRLRDAVKPTAPACRSGASRASACWRCRASACALRWASPATSAARAAMASAASAASNRWRSPSCA